MAIADDVQALQANIDILQARLGALTALDGEVFAFIEQMNPNADWDPQLVASLIGQWEAFKGANAGKDLSGGLKAALGTTVSEPPTTTVATGAVPANP